MPWAPHQNKVHAKVQNENLFKKLLYWTHTHKTIFENHFIRLNLVCCEIDNIYSNIRTHTNFWERDHKVYFSFRIPSCLSCIVRTWTQINLNALYCVRTRLVREKSPNSNHSYLYYFRCLVRSTSYLS